MFLGLAKKIDTVNALVDWKTTELASSSLSFAGERPYHPRDCADGASPKGDLETRLQRSARDGVDSGLTGDWKAPSGDHGHLGEEEPGSPDQIP